MGSWWNSLEIMQKVLYCIAGTTTLIFAVQAVMTFVGMDSDSGLDADANADGFDGVYPFQLFTFRNLINFLLGFSWCGLVFYHSVGNLFLLGAVSTLFGCILVGVVMWMFFQLSKMVQSGNISIEETVGLNANVYLVIAGHRERMGKVQLSVKGSIREYDAVTDGDTLKTGDLAVVERVLEGNILLVKKLNN
ncbi:MAG: hypothetical protein FWH36_01195 [Lentimicrobiaceae bacterium]|nr:hypothetical protein [Lentimicrobiaceae bacterium]